MTLSPNTAAEDPLLVPTVPVGMPFSTLCVGGQALGRGSVQDGIPTLSVGTKACANRNPRFAIREDRGRSVRCQF